MLANSFLLHAFLMYAQNPLEVKFKSAVFHIIANIQAAQPVRKYLVRKSQKRAYQPIMFNVCLVYLTDQLVQLLAKRMLRSLQFNRTIKVAFAQFCLINVGVLDIYEQREVAVDCFLIERVI